VSHPYKTGKFIVPFLHYLYFEIRHAYLQQNPPPTLKDKQWRTQEFCSGGFQQIQLRTEDRENRDLGAAAP